MWIGWMEGGQLSKCVGNQKAGRSKKRWIESVKECLIKRNVDFLEAKKCEY